MVKVSLIVPVYKTEKYLNKCIDSILNQTLKDIEVIIINDGSPDNSEKVIKKYNDSRIKYFKQENQGIGKTRNLGIEKSQGEYIAFVDSDDYLDLHFCEYLYNKCYNDNCDVALCDYYEERDSITRVNFKIFKDTNLEKTPSLINNINLGPCNKLYKRSLLIENNILFEEKLKYEDAPFVVKALLNAKKIGKLDEALTYYVIHEKSQTTIRDARIFDIIEIVNIIDNEMSKFANMHEAKVNLITMILLDYTIQQRYVEDKKMRNKFIDEAFSYLDKMDKNWPKCSYLKNIPFSKRIVKSNKLLTKIYCSCCNSKQ